MSIFIPRLTPPTTTDAYWKRPLNPYDDGTYGLPNCTCYAYGRFMEILGTKPNAKFGRGNAGLYWWEAKDGYKRGQTPKLGAVAVYRNRDNPYTGHVAVVEMILADGSIVLSNSGWSETNRNPQNWKWFYTYGKYPTSYPNPGCGYTAVSPASNFDCGTGKLFVGFIYNPAVPDDAQAVLNLQTAFADVANKHINDQKDWVLTTTGYRDAPNLAWNVLYVMAVSKACKDITTDVIPRGVQTIGSFMRNAIDMGAVFSKGPYFGSGISPYVGDIVCLRNSGTAYTQDYLCDYIGIITKVDKKQITACVGDLPKGNVGQNYYQLDCKQISGILSFNWGRSAGNRTSAQRGTAQLYNTTNAITDAMIRTVAYCDKDGKPYINSTGIPFAILNYTGLATALLKAVNQTANNFTLGSGETVNYSRFSQLQQIIIENLLYKGLPISSVIGILSTFELISQCQATYVNKDKKEYGIFGWKGDRFTALRKYAGDGWQESLSRQVNYFYSELSTSFVAVLDTLVGNTTLLEDSVIDAGSLVLRNMYQVSSDILKRNSQQLSDTIETENLIRTERTKSDTVVIDSMIEDLKPIISDLWDKLVVTTDAGNVATMNYKNGQPIQLSRSIPVPADLKQSGIIRDFTSYSFYLHHRAEPAEDGWTKGWHPSTTQRKIADAWEAQGKPHTRGIATLDGYYLVALTLETFGYAGDIVKIYLEDGTVINAIMGDEKRKNNEEENSNEYGHIKETGTSIVEWEVVDPDNADRRAPGYAVPADAKPITTPVPKWDITQSLDLTGWAGKKVAKIENYGSWLK